MSIPDPLRNIENPPKKDLTTKDRIRTIIFGTHTPAGKAFDIILLVLILVTVLSVMLESVGSIADRYGLLFRTIEWVITILFTIEYIMRIVVTKKSIRYVISAFGIIDLLSIIPTYLSLILTGTGSFAIIRALRLLRIFRVLKLMRFLTEAQVLGRALYSSRHKIIVFFFFVLISVFILGTLMYVVEGPDSGFDSIPLSIYWAIVTLTTVGFGDITPQSVEGQIIASIVMLLGYSIIAIPTGIVGAQIYREMDAASGEDVVPCNNCGHPTNPPESLFCNQCGQKLDQSHDESR